MAKDNQILVRVNDPTDEAIESFAEKHDYTKAEAVRRMVEDRLTGEGHMSSSRAVPDGGQILNQIEAVEKAQQDRLNEIEQQIESVNKEKSVLEEWLDSVRFGATGATIGSIIAYILSVTSLISMNPNAALLSTGISTAFLLIFIFIQDVIQ